MPATDSPVVKARRDRLRSWIKERFKGSRKDFVADAEARGHKIDPTEVSNLQTGRKSFGEKKAAALEVQARMPPGYLVTPLLPADAGKRAPREQADERSSGLQIARLENDIHAINMALGTLMATMVEHRPAEAVEAAAALRKKSPKEYVDQGLILELIEVLEKAKPARRQGVK
jgi:hypothetical protein